MCAQSARSQRSQPAQRSQRSLRGIELTTAATNAINQIRPWLEGQAEEAQVGNTPPSKTPPSITPPSRAQLAEAVRLSAQLLAQDAPGHSVEVRIPPFVAVQCIDGPVHRRGTPPNVVQCSPKAWLLGVVGLASLKKMAEQPPGRKEKMMDKIAVEMSGTRAGEVDDYLPLFGAR